MRRVVIPPANVVTAGVFHQDEFGNQGRLGRAVADLRDLGFRASVDRTVHVRAYTDAGTGEVLRIIGVGLFHAVQPAAAGAGDEIAGEALAAVRAASGVVRFHLRRHAIARAQEHGDRRHAFGVIVSPERAGAGPNHLVKAVKYGLFFHEWEHFVKPARAAVEMRTRAVHLAIERAVRRKAEAGVVYGRHLTHRQALSLRLE